jgi:ADP-ribose pyrophosphatase YjhB (NUDIX family)
MASELIDAYTHCPICGSAELRREGEGVTCGNCGHRDFNNPIAAVAVFVFDPEGRVLMIKRAKEPAMGMWAPPGGFINAGETLEEAAAREIAEETGLELRDLQYLCSFPNNYVYRGLSRPVSDVFFVAQASSHEVKTQEEEVSGFRYVLPEEVVSAELAFDSMRRAWEILRQKHLY